MTKRPDLPPRLLQAPFSIAQARTEGVDAAELRTRSLQRSFHAVRSLGLDFDRLEDRCRAYAAVQATDAVFSHTTAAALWGFPLPRTAQHPELHVTRPVGSRASAGRGIRGHQQRMLDREFVTVGGLAVASPAAAWAQSAESLSVTDLIAAGDYALTGNPFENLLPLATIDDLLASTNRRRGGPGHRRRLLALEEVCEGALSRPETHARILFLRCGIPRPLINEWVRDERGSDLALPDLHWPEWKVAFEYEGDHHRGVRQFRRDVRRVEVLIDHGWLVLRASADDLYLYPGELVARLARRLASHGWGGRIDLRRVTRFAP